ncbi:MAG: penicillin-binding transpeptidase domain-containing protein, partial [Oscillospiraceae bacterium]
TDNQGLAGLEAFYDKQLQGTPGRVVTAKNAWGTDMPTKYEKLFEAQNGNSLVTTIDQGVQMYLEKYLETAISEYKVKSKACGIIMDVKTGGILAMATKPDFDPNQPLVISDKNIIDYINTLPTEEQSAARGRAQSDQWRNKAVSDLYEPGSVFKIVTGSAGLEEKVTNKDDHFNCSGSVIIGTKQRYNCHKTTGHGGESFIDGMKNSCNPVFIEIGKRLGVDLFDKYLKAFGIAEKTGIDLPGESESISHKSYSIFDLASNSFGQTIKITPIQMMSAACAAINGGYLYEPYVVSSIIDDKGNIVQAIEPNAKRQVISSDTSAVIRQALEKVITEGGGKNAAVQGYRVGGKSGTSQKLDIADKEARIASFFAFAPVEDPQIAILIICDDPQVQSQLRYGSMISAPIVSSVLTEVLPYLGLEPEYTEEQLSKMNVQVSSVIDKEVSSAKTTLEG